MKHGVELFSLASRTRWLDDQSANECDLAD